MLSSKQKVGVIIVDWRAPDITSACVRTALDSNYTDCVVYLVVNESHGRNVYSEFSIDSPNRLVVLQNLENIGFVKALNQAIRYAMTDGCRFVMLLHNDAFLMKDTIELLVNEAKKDERTGIIAPCIVDFTTKIPLRSAGRFNYKLGVPLSVACQKAPRMSLDFVNEVGMTIDVGVLKKVGLLDEQFIMGNFDYDICYRAKRAGYKIRYVTSAKIEHYYSYSRIRARQEKSGRRDWIKRTVSLVSFLRLGSKLSKVTLPFWVFSIFVYHLPLLFFNATKYEFERNYLLNVFKRLLP